MSWPKDVTRKDLRIEHLKGSGRGGQRRNKKLTAVRITHLPTREVGYSEDERSQSQNLSKAFKRLVTKLIPLMKKEALRERYSAPETRIRTYHEPRQSVIDHRIDDTRWKFDDIVYGNKLEEIILTLQGKLDDQRD